MIEIAQLKATVASANTTHCSKVAVGASITTPPLIALPIRTEFEALFSHDIDMLVSAQRYTSTLIAHSESLSQCPESVLYAERTVRMGGFHEPKPQP